MPERGKCLGHCHPLEIEIEEVNQNTWGRQEGFDKQRKYLGLPINAEYQQRFRRIYSADGTLLGGFITRSLITKCKECNEKLEPRCMKHGLPLIINIIPSMPGWRTCEAPGPICAVELITFYAPKGKGCAKCKHWTEINLDEKPLEEKELEELVKNEEIRNHLEELYDEIVDP